MKRSKVIFAMCSLLTAYSMTGFSVNGTFSGDVVDEAVVGDEFDVLIDFDSDSDETLTDSQTKSLASYIKDSTGSQYSGLTFKERSKLCVIIAVHQERFDKNNVAQFFKDQQSLAGLTSQEIRDFNGAILDIQKGDNLTPKQVFMIKALQTKISAFPAAFIIGLQPLTKYAAAHSELFSSGELADLRKSSMMASGFTSDDVSKLNEIANRKTTALSSDDAKVVRLYASRIGIGSSDAVDPLVVARLFVIVNANSAMFPPSLVNTFNYHSQENQKLQMHIEKNESKGSAPHKIIPEPKPMGKGWKKEPRA